MYQVMLADDEKWIIEGLKNIIDWKALGLEIRHTASNGKEAIEKFYEEAVDFVITDINMPGINGLELLKSIKEKSPHTQFIILSGYDEFSYAKEAISLGVKCYILKPIDEEELEETLKELVEKLEKTKIVSPIDVYKERNFDMAKLQRFIMSQDQISASQYLKTLLGQFEKQTDSQGLYPMCIKIIMLLNEICRELGLSKEEDVVDLRQMIDYIYHEEELEGLTQFVKYKLLEVMAQINPKEIKYTPVVQQVISYIEECYQEEMSLKTLAQKYHMNASYLGQIFLREVGCSFSEYLNQIKNSKAKELILNTNFKINDIAKMVGYLDTSYFYKKFKRYYGVSPVTLREMKVY